MPFSNFCALLGVHTYPPYEELLGVISALNADIVESLVILSDAFWDGELAGENII